MKSKFGIFVGLTLVLMLGACQSATPPSQQQQLQNLDQLQQTLEQLQNADQLYRSTQPTTQPGKPSIPDQLAVTLQNLQIQVSDLKTQIQNSPTPDQTRQIAIDAAIKTAQGLASQYGGQYGTLIAAGLGLAGILIQGIFGAKKAADTAQAHAETVAGMSKQLQDTNAALVGAIGAQKKA